MRIVGGKFRGTALAALGKGDAGAHLRPTSDRVREALFNVLASRGGVEGARVLDLFAGTGALGLEALSRGAVHVTAVDDGHKARALIRENVEKLRAMGEVKLYRRDAVRLGENRGAAFDLVFLDPPYGKGLGQRALASAVEGGWIAPEALIVWEESAPMEAPEGFDLIEHRAYGDTHITLMEKS
ncbi:16S rRNA (guanine(966)-N(2))-methyltransferase RsmD [Vannielia litorea]|uniref:16S rRNA (guanine(966)-N(2))-methyltransferase RsmD n=1 Tax=Vannielia TaxID=2813041 RepID=UPI001C93F902|nr:16S rRNA (guanine(966)-N(2))-methyltransferase RsmD [Vannielia litorea]MBY6049891.1 16S rRNA (guanine(966)-N(2))-methyltransferase RsmD [Vannielia litorea]MBY6077305.1 16S rRNA (guanine(966)-N(2))-methyltransferase RsmD [Vannielia litorea]